MGVRNIRDKLQEMGSETPQHAKSYHITMPLKSSTLQSPVFSASKFAIVPKHRQMTPKPLVKN
jgi:hypothetical protein